MKKATHSMTEFSVKELSQATTLSLGQVREIEPGIINSKDLSCVVGPVIVGPINTGMSTTLDTLMPEPSVS